MFWRFNNMCTTNIDNLLNEEDVTLHRLMDEDDIIQECKSSNRKLINFLVKTEVLHELIGLVTKEPSTSSPDAVRFKYNNIAAELFSCDVPAINDALVSDETLLNELCEFIYNEPPLNPLMASFFSKSMAVLVGRKSDKMLEYLKAKEGFLSQLLKHLRTSAIMDLVLKLVTCVENRSSRIDIAQWLCSEHFVESLIGLLSGNTEPDLHGNVAQLLCDLLRLLRDVYAQSVANENGADQSNEPIEVDPILSSLESKVTVDLLLDHILGGELGESSIVHGITVLLTLLEVRRPPQLMSSEPEVFERTPPDPVVNTCIRNTVEAVIPRLKDFHQILLHPPQKIGYEMPASACRTPFGFVRSQVTRLIAALIATGSLEVQKEFSTLDTFSLLMDMLLEFSHNNFLHAHVERSIQHITGLEPTELLRSPAVTPTAEEGGETEPKNEPEEPASPSPHPLLAHLIIETCLPRRIMEAWELNDQEESLPGGLRRAYMGHLIRMANYIVEFGKHGKNAAKIQQLISDLPEDVRTKWQEFVDNKLAQANRNNEIIPVTSTMVAPRASSDEEESDLIRHALPRDTAAQEVFAEYQMEVMTKHVVSQFGLSGTQFNDGEDNNLRPDTDALGGLTMPDESDELAQQTELFEQVCSERMRDKSAASGIKDDNDDETWLQEMRRRSNANTSAPRKGSSSDEDDIADANDSMDIDNVDPWGTTGDSAIPVAVDAGNPWDTVPAAATSDVPEENWANFDSFSSAIPMEITDSPSTAVEEMSSAETKEESTTSATDGSDQISAIPDQPNGPA